MSDIKEVVRKRQYYNLKIVDALYVFFETYPEMRFFQGLQNLKLQFPENINDNMFIPDNFHEESEVTYNKIEI